MLLSFITIAGACSGSDEVLVQRDPEGADAVGSVVPAVPDTTSSVDCPPESGADTVTRDFPDEPPFCLDRDASYSAKVTTSAGDLTIDLDQDAAPVTVNNFVFLARNNYFDDTVCHRVIQDFVVQCGDPTATGSGGPGYTITDEFPEAGEYEVGSVAMAKTQAPNSGGSQFFIISGPGGAELPPLYSLFGDVPDSDLGVVADMNAVGSLDQGGVPSEEIRIEDVEITQS